jgi:hypothetical protein
MSLFISLLRCFLLLGVAHYDGKFKSICLVVELLYTTARLASQCKYLQVGEGTGTAMQHLLTHIHVQAYFGMKRYMKVTNEIVNLPRYLLRSSRSFIPSPPPQKDPRSNLDRKITYIGYLLRSSRSFIPSPPPQKDPRSNLDRKITYIGVQEGPSNSVIT